MGFRCMGHSVRVFNFQALFHSWTALSLSLVFWQFSTSLFRSIVILFNKLVNYHFVVDFVRVYIANFSNVQTVVFGPIRRKKEPKIITKQNKYCEQQNEKIFSALTSFPNFIGCFDIFCFRERQMVVVFLQSLLFILQSVYTFDW